MQDAVKSSPPVEDISWEAPATTCNERPTAAHEEGNWDEAKTQPLATLYQHQMILSPSHDEDEEDEEEGEAPVMGDMIDFDEHAMGASGSKSGSAAATRNVYVSSEEEDVCVNLDTVLDLEMFEDVFEEIHEETPKTTEMMVTSDEDDEASSETSSLKRVSKSSKGEEAKHDCPALKKAKTLVAAVVVPSTKDKIVPAMTALPKQPRHKRPNCLFINHFGTRLDQKGVAVQVDTPSKVRTPNRISSEESVSIKTKSTSSSKTSSSTGSDTKKTPVNDIITSSPSDTKTPTKVPSVVRIVTPTVKKPITSSARIEDIHMEEDDLEPLRHDNNEGEILVDSDHLPYIQSLTDDGPQPTGAASIVIGGCQPMMQGMMASPQRIPLNFTRPFPLLQRRAFLSGCHPMTHPQAFAGPHPSNWLGGGYVGQAMAYDAQMNAYPGAPGATGVNGSMSQQSQWQQK